MEVRGGAGDGGATAVAVGYGYEACNARHDQTNFVEDSEFYMTFLGPLQFIDEDGNTPGRRGLGTGRRPVGTADRTSVGRLLSRLIPLSQPRLGARHDRPLARVTYRSFRKTR